MADFTIGEDDILPAIAATLKDELGVAVNLTGATVKFHMGIAGQAPKINAAATVDNAASGTVHYDWVSGDTDTPGTYEAEWEVTYTVGTKIITFPNTATKISILVTEQIA